MMDRPEFLPASELTGSQIEQLLQVARDIFDTTFGGDYDRAPFEAFLDKTYAPGGSMRRDLTDAAIEWRIATVADAPVGYAKLTPLRAPVPDASPGALELQQIYLLPDWHGSGVAQHLMDWGVAAARARGADELYLTVFDHNLRAKRFYARNGFAEVGRCTFQLGDKSYDDRIWRKPL